jgi:hypothetical protein
MTLNALYKAPISSLEGGVTRSEKSAFSEMRRAVSASRRIGSDTMPCSHTDSVNETDQHQAQQQ